MAAADAQIGASGAGSRLSRQPWYASGVSRTENATAGTFDRLASMAAPTVPELSVNARPAFSPMFTPDTTRRGGI